jgi:hypothetical protein
MPELFRLVKEEFNETHRERQWTYAWLAKFVFNEQTINKTTITDHYLISHKDVINNELILNILGEKVNRENLKPTKYQGKRKVFKWEGDYKNKCYRMIFWFENNNSGWLWIKDCYPIN